MLGVKPGAVQVHTEHTPFRWAPHAQSLTCWSKWCLCWGWIASLICKTETWPEVFSSWQARIPACPELTSASVCSEYSHCKFSRWFLRWYFIQESLRDLSQARGWTFWCRGWNVKISVSVLLRLGSFLAMSLDSAEKSHWHVWVWGENESNMWWWVLVEALEPAGVTDSFCPPPEGHWCPVVAEDLCFEWQWNLKVVLRSTHWNWFLRSSCRV